MSTVFISTLHGSFRNQAGLGGAGILQLGIGTEISETEKTTNPGDSRKSVPAGLPEFPGTVTTTPGSLDIPNLLKTAVPSISVLDGNIEKS